MSNHERTTVALFVEIITNPRTAGTVSTDRVVEGEVFFFFVVVVVEVEVEAVEVAFIIIIISKVRPVNMLFIKAAEAAITYIKAISNIKETIMDIIRDTIRVGINMAINQITMTNNHLRLIWLILTRTSRLKRNQTTSSLVSWLRSKLEVPWRLVTRRWQKSLWSTQAQHIILSTHNHFSNHMSLFILKRSSPLRDNLVWLERDLLLCQSTGIFKSRRIIRRNFLRTLYPSANWLQLTRSAAHLDTGTWRN